MQENWDDPSAGWDDGEVGLILSREMVARGSLFVNWLIVLVRN